MLTLAIETSCDETSAAVLNDGREVLSNVIASQIETHKRYGGVVPEIASRQHVEVISQVIDEALKRAEIEFKDLDLVSATYGPGLIGALLVGLTAGKSIAAALDLPFVGVNHIIGHICANYISHPDLKPPFIGLIISGGHTYLLEVKDYVKFDLVGRTADDAVGEAYDKVARAMGLPYPGGPVIDRIAKEGRDIYNFPRALISNGYDFSFSGLKTAVLNQLNSLNQKNESYRKEDIACSFQEAVVDVLSEKTFKFAKERDLKKIAICGGVSANSRIRNEFIRRAEAEGYEIYYPSMDLCTDNAAMIASAAYYLYRSKEYPKKIFAKPNLSL